MIMAAVFMMAPQTFAAADGGDTASSYVTDNNKNVKIESKSGAVLDRNSGLILYDKNADQKMYPASCTKVLTALVTLENAKDLKIVTRRQSAKAFMKQAHQPKKEGGYGVDMLIAVNASPWTPWKEPWNHKFACHMGLTVAQGEILDTNDLGRPSFIVYKNGKVDFRTDKNKATIKNEDLYISVPGFAVILDNGTVTPWAADDKSVHPRTGYGLSKDRRYLYFIVVDGRQKDYSIGATTGEIAQLLKEYGAEDALNMDGGGSTTLAVWNPQAADKDGKTPDPVKIYTHQAGGWLRANANNLGICLKKEK